MIFRDQHERSLLPKGFVAVALLTSICISASLMFSREVEIFGLQAYKTNGDLMRRILILACFIIYFLRLLMTLFVFFRRKMYWIEAIIIANLLPWVFPYVAYIGGNNKHAIGEIEVIGILLFFFGSYLNTASEYSRHTWKRKEENQGHLYIQGLFRYARHVNYLGDLILFTGLVMVAHQFVLLIIPFSMGGIFVLILIPLKERYLRNKYGREFEEYAVGTKRLIPMIY